MSDSASDIWSHSALNWVSNELELTKNVGYDTMTESSINTCS